MPAAAAPNAQAELFGFAAAEPCELLAFRQTDYDVPFWARNNSYDGRWNVAGDPPTQYWSMHPDGAWAEFLRQEELQDAADVRLIRRPIWVCRIVIGSLLDLRGTSQQEQHEIAPTDLVDPDWGACQRLARRLRAAGVGAILSPSAALDGHDNLTIFGARRAIHLHRRPVLQSTVPAAIVARGRPSPELLDAIRRTTPTPGSDQLFD